MTPSTRRTRRQADRATALEALLATGGIPAGPLDGTPGECPHGCTGSPSCTGDACTFLCHAEPSGPEDVAAAIRYGRAAWWVPARARSGLRLHAVLDGTWTRSQLDDISWAGAVRGPVLLACGRTAGAVGVPGPFTRLGALRCAGCCRKLGFPHGKGSPLNDSGCRALLGLAAAPGRA